MYTASLEDIIKSHLGVDYMVYDDDTQLYLVINASYKDECISQLSLVYSLHILTMYVA